MPPTLQQATADPRLGQRLLDAHGQVWVSLLWSLLLSPGSWRAQGFICALQESVSPVLCKIWQLYGGVNGNLLQEGVCHSQVRCTQSPCPCGSPLLTHMSPGDIQTLRGRSGSVSVGPPGAHKVLFVTSKSLFPWSCVSFGGSMVGLTVTSSKRAYGIPKSVASRAPAPAAGHC